MEEKLLLTNNDLQNSYGIPRVRVYQILNDKSLPVIHLGRRLYVRRSDFEEWLDKQMKREA